MKNKEAATEMAVGLFVTILFAGLFVFTIVISGKDLLGKGVRKMEVVLPDAMGLRANDAVYSRGAPVGTVTRVEFEEDGVHVDAKLNRPLTLHEGYSIRVVATSILGGRQLVVESGDASAPRLEDNVILTGEKSADLMSEATEVVKNFHEMLDAETIANVRASIANLRGFSDKLAAFGDAMGGSGASVSNLLVSGETLVTNLNAVAVDLRAVSGRLERGEGTLGKLFSSDDSLYADLSASIKDLRSVIARVEAGKGTIGKLFSEDETAYEDLKGALASLRSIGEKIDRGEGSLGKLLTEDGLYRNADGVVTDAREFLDDMREANTLSTFSSILFGGF